MVPLQHNPQTLTPKPFRNRLQTIAEEVEKVLDGIVLPLPTTRLHEAMRYCVLGGGKRLRAFFVWESCQLFDVSREDVLKAAAATELIQAYSLVHDDLPCMDNADMRRGKPSCHKVFGDATATLVGDALIPLAFEILASLEALPDRRLSLISSLAKVIGSEGLVAGQMSDLGQEGPCQTLEDVLTLQRLKTSVFFGFSAEVGAILGGGSLQDCEALRSYGLLFGQAFQMIDDWLDAYGTPEAIGKPCGQDIEKKTLLSFLDPDLLYKKAETLLEEAIQKLTIFGDRASLLKEAAMYALKRES
jgi:farnesyl diphosphate synthase